MGNDSLLVQELWKRAVQIINNVCKSNKLKHAKCDMRVGSDGILYLAAMTPFGCDVCEMILTQMFEWGTARMKGSKGNRRQREHFPRNRRV